MFYAPQNTPQGFYITKNRVLVKKRQCVSPFPQGLFMSPKTRTRVFPEAKVAFGINETLVWHTPPPSVDSFMDGCVEAGEVQVM